MGDPVELQIGAITTLTLNRPDRRNAMTVETGEALCEAVARINASDEPRVVLVRGRGRSFSAGGDFDVLEANSLRAPEDNRRAMLNFYRIHLSILEIRVPTIAVLHGAAVGAGLCLAMACDLRIAANDAKLGANFVRVGLHPGMGCSLLLPRLVGPARASELMLTGRLLLGDEAARIGLVTEAVAAEELETRVEQMATAIATAAPVAVIQTKATLLQSLWDDLERALATESASQAISFATADLKEAVAAFRDGRPPNFLGR